MLVNLKKWQSLTEPQKAFLNKMALWLESTNANNAAINRNEAKRQADAGMTVITLTGAERDKWIGAARKAGWEQVERLAPANAKRLEELLTK